MSAVVQKYNNNAIADKAYKNDFVFVMFNSRAQDSLKSTRKGSGALNFQNTQTLPDPRIFRRERM